jgi:hypothetical protein
VQKWCTFSCKAAQRIKQPSSSCYKGEDKTLGQFSDLDESKKAGNPALELSLGCFHGLDESQRCSPYPGLFSQPGESKRAEKMLELTLSQVFLGLDESKKTKKPRLNLS